MVDFTMAWYGDWQGISLLAAALSVIIASFLIMIGRLLELKNLERTAKSEFVYAISTVLIVVIVVTLLISLEQFLAGGGASLAKQFYLISFRCDLSTQVIFSQNTLIDWMKLYLAAPAACVQKFLGFLYLLSIPVETMASQYMEIFMSEIASGFGVKWISILISNTVQNLSFFMYVYYLLFHSLNFVKYYAGFFFSVGVALRAFPPTRGAGAYVMALAIGFYFVLPLTYITISTIAMPIVGGETITPEGYNINVPDAATCELNDDERSVGYGGVKFLCTLPQVPGDLTAMQCSGASPTIATGFKNAFLLNSDILKNFLSFNMADIGRHLLYAVCIFPLIALLVMITFVLNTTSLFGGTIPEVGRGLIKLI